MEWYKGNLVADQREVITNYFNTAGVRMESFFSDLFHDAKTIEKLQEGETAYFFVFPNCTHSYKNNNIITFEDYEDELTKTWGNHIVCKVTCLGDNKYQFDHHSKTLDKGYDTKNKKIIDLYERFYIREY